MPPSSLPQQSTEAASSAIDSAVPAHLDEGASWLPTRWQTMLMGLVMEVSACTTYAVPLYTPLMRGVFNFSQTQMTSVLSAADVGLFFGVVNGLIFDKWGPRVSSVVLAVMLSGAYIAVWAAVKGWITHNVVLVVFLYLMIGSGSNMNNCVAVSTNVKNWPQSYRGRVVGSLKSMYGAGLIMYSFLYKFVFSVAAPLEAMEHFFLFLCIFTACTSALSIVCMRIEPAPAVKPAVVTKSVSSSALTVELSGCRLLTNLRFWVLWLTFCVAQSSSLVIVNNLGAVLQSVGSSCGQPISSSAQEQFISVIALGAANIVGRSAGGWLNDKLPPNWVYVGIVFLLGLNNFLLGFASSVTAVIAGATAAALLFGANNTLVSCLVSDFGLKAYGTNLGYMTTAPGIGIIVFNLIAGRLYDAQINCDFSNKCYGTQCFRLAFFIAAAAAFLAFLASFYMPLQTRCARRPRPKRGLPEDDESTTSLLLPHTEHSNSHIDDGANKNIQEQSD